MSFAVAYGLCLQGLGKAELRTNLLPEEIVRTRLVLSKKPWAVAGAAAILAGLTFNYFSHVSAWRETDNEAIKSAESQATSVSSTAQGYQSEKDTIHNEFKTVSETGEKLISNVEGRLPGWSF